ncbi:MAG TPA: sensor histidine kinase [Sediminibacterium sp.]|nr:sensor histidine kinase [Sediminibacterium sp.]
MTELLKERKLLYRLIIIALITTPLLALLGGTPLLRIEFSKLRYFFPVIAFNLLTILFFWIVNIALLLIGFRILFLGKWIPRLIFSSILCLTFSALLFSYFFKNFPPPSIRFSEKVLQKEIGPPVETGHFADTTFAKKLPEFKEGMYLIHKRPEKKRFFISPLVNALMTNIIILILCELVTLYFKKQKIEDENTLLKQSNLEAKNNQLKMQLHPHFLFNSLNTLRLLLKKDPNQAEDYLLKLSDILRFSTSTALDALVDMSDELKLCISYLEMQKVRFGNMISFGVNNEKIFSVKGKLPVYALQTLAENAIKHNAFSTETPLHISIDYNEINQSITIHNRINRRNFLESTSKVGLKNLTERYRLLSEKRVIISNSGIEFSVTIPILPGNTIPVDTELKPK